jgi:tetratricopeptide (TPR) repeat protein
MRKAVIIPLVFFFFVAAFAQKPKTAGTKPAAAKPGATPPKTKPAAAKATPKPKVKPRDPAREKEEFEKAAAITDAAEKIAALEKYIAAYPKSEQLSKAQELLVTSRAVIADQKLQARENESGVALFKLAVKDAPVPIPDKLFDSVVVNFPTNLFLRGQPAAAIEIAKMIEEKSAASPRQLVSLAAFYIGIEQAGEAKRIGEKIVALDPNMPDAYQTLGLAYRMNFQPEESARAYQKALELKPDSVISKRSLAEMKRSLGKADEAAALYREILAANPDDTVAGTGLILCLFDSGKKEEADSEMAKSLEKAPNNLPLLAGAAYWYAAQGDGSKAVELAQKAIEIEPRYIWSHIARARGYMSQKKPLDAERVLLSARKYGNFPTLEYEIASARIMAGFYREAAEELEKSFEVKDGMVNAYLGGRVMKEAKTFIDLVAFERRASIFEPLAADNAENSARLKALLDLNQRITAKEQDEAATVTAADEFINGDDKMKFHRQLYVASLLLQKKTALAKVQEIIKTAINDSDNSLDGPHMTSAILADQLYESRAISMARNQLILVPEVPRQTLSAIVRGKIEDITGWTLFQQGKTVEATLHLRRAVSVLPDKSAWWRASLWRLAAVLEAEGKDKEALDSYIKSYITDRPDGFKYMAIESLYRKVNGNTDGLEAKVGPNPAPVVVSQKEIKPPEPEAQKFPDALPVAKPDTTPEVKTTATPEISTTQTTEPTPGVKTEPSPETPKTESTPEVKTEPSPEPVGTPKTEPPSEVKAEPSATQTTEPLPSPSPENIQPIEDPAKNPSDNPSETEKAKPVEGTAQNKPKDLFEPIVIRIPSAQRPRKIPPDPVTTAIKKVEAEEKKPDSPEGERARIVAVKNETTEPETPKCTLSLSQESVSLLSDGGSLGILVSFEGEGSAQDIKAVSSSPSDVGVAADPTVGSQRKAFFVIKSISVKSGLFSVTFEMPCGKKEISVKVN